MVSPHGSSPQASVVVKLIVLYALLISNVPSTFAKDASRTWMFVKNESSVSSSESTYEPVVATGSIASLKLISTVTLRGSSAPSTGTMLVTYGGVRSISVDTSNVHEYPLAYAPENAA